MGAMQTRASRIRLPIHWESIVAWRAPHRDPALHQACDKCGRGPDVLMPFFDAARQRLTIPRRFRIIGTVNSYDKNFLFRMSYALTRLSLIHI